MLFFAVTLLVSVPCRAEDAPAGSEMQALREQMETLRKDFEQLQQRYERDVLDLQGRVRELSDELAERRTIEAESETVYEDIYERAPAVIYQAPQVSGQGLGQVFNPDVSVIGDVLAQYTSHENEGDKPDDEFIFRELEINFSGLLDPFARADVVVALHKEFEHEVEEEHEGEHEESVRGHSHEHDFAIHIEEAYLTALTLPYGLQARVGRMRERFGKINTVHLHALPWVDYPLVVKNYFGHEGLMGDGAEVSWLAPTQHYLELSYEVFNNDNNSVFAGEDYDDFAHLLHAKNLLEFSDATTLEFGGTVATAPNDDGHGGSRTWLEGIDLTFKWRPLQEALYKSLTWQTEALFSQKDTDEGDRDTWGLYSSLEHQFARRWKAAARYDYSELPDFENLREHGYSAYLTFAQSEYVFWRFGYMFVDRNFPDPEQEDEHVLWLQCNFGLGPHRAHEY